MATSSVQTALHDVAAALPTYVGPEALDLDAAPAGFALDRYDAIVGHGPADFDRARLGLRTWATHLVRGVGVQPPSTPVSLGAVYLVTLGTPFASIAAPCRVTRVTDEAAHWGFSYRTLPGHPELGEEAFDVRIDEGGDVRLGITAVSRHAGLVMQIAGPAARVVQRRVTRAYGRALRDFVAARS
jgi:uncharacterized protein (UPF0548 family)